MLNSIASVPDHCLFIYFTYHVLSSIVYIKQALTLMSLLTLFTIVFIQNKVHNNLIL